MDVPNNVLPPTEESSTGDVKPAEKPVQVVVDKQPEQAPKGSHSPDTRLYAALEDERKKRKELETRLNQLESAPSQEAFTEKVDEDFRGQITELRDELHSVKTNLELERVYAEFPDLKEKKDEFLEYRKEYPGADLQKVAKLWAVDKGLLPTSRKGLEKASSGPKTPPQPAISDEDLERLRTTQPRKFAKMLQNGDIKIDKLM